MFRKLMEQLGQSGASQKKAVQPRPHGNDADEMLRSRCGPQLFASQYDLDCAGLLFRHMGTLRLPYLGGHFAPEHSDGGGGHRFSQLFAPPEGHLLTIAGDGEEARSRQIIPNILTYRGSIVIVDPDGLLCEATSNARHDEPDHPGHVRRVFRFDPFGARTDCYNPLDALTEEASGRWQDACIMADMLVAPHDRRNEVEVQARALLAGILFHVARSSGEDGRTIASVRDLTAMRSEGFEALRTQMAESANDHVRAAEAAFRELGKGMQRAVRQRLDEDLAIWDAPHIRAATAVSDEDFQMRFLHHYEGMTIYLVVPQDRLEAAMPLVRLLVGQAATCYDKPMYGTAAWADARPSGPPVMLIVDPIEALGYMAPLVERMLAYETQHLKMWWFTRSLSALEEACDGLHPDIFFDRFHTITACAIDDEATAEQLARRLDKRITRRRKQLYLDDDYAFVSAREIRNLPASTGIALIKGLPPVLLRLPEHDRIEGLR